MGPAGQAPFGGSGRRPAILPWAPPRQCTMNQGNSLTVRCNHHHSAPRCLSPASKQSQESVKPSPKIPVRPRCSAGHPECRASNPIRSQGDFIARSHAGIVSTRGIGFHPIPRRFHRPVPRRDRFHARDRIPSDPKAISSPGPTQGSFPREGSDSIRSQGDFIARHPPMSTNQSSSPAPMAPEDDSDVASSATSMKAPSPQIPAATATAERPWPVLPHST